MSFGNQRVTQNGKVLACRIPTAPKQVFEGDEILQKLLPKRNFGVITQKKII